MLVRCRISTIVPHLCKKISDTRGSTSVELAAVIPLIALFISLCLQFASVFEVAEANAIAASNEAKKTIGEWQSVHEGDGALRPCLENIEPRSVAFQGKIAKIGFGPLGWKGGLAQEVVIASESICVAR